METLKLLNLSDNEKRELWKLNDKNDKKYFTYKGFLFYGKKGLCNCQSVKNFDILLEKLNS